ncbi:MAG: PAS domain S-box protein [Nitrosomonadales bacterium]
MITDADGNIIKVNQAFTDITGYSAAEGTGENLHA